jgi:hypothetical protein
MFRKVLLLSSAGREKSNTDENGVYYRKARFAKQGCERTGFFYAGSRFD